MDEPDASPSFKNSKMAMVPLTDMEEGGDFSIPISDFQDLIDPKSLQKYNVLGGLEAIRTKLRTDLKKGLSEEVDQVEKEGELAEVPYGLRKKKYGENILPKAKSTSFLQLVLNALSDKTLLILILAACISIGVGIYEDIEKARTGDPGYVGSWVEGIAILVAVVVVVLVNSINDWKKEKQFRKLNDKKDDREVQVVRNGIQQQISIFDLVVGDVALLNTGDVIPADGIFIEGHNLKCDESGMTGESDAIKKSHEKDPFLLSGTKVLDGVGSMVVIAVGPYSLNGKTMLSLRTEAEDTPLQIKLGELAETIGKFGLSAAIILLIILIIRYFVVTYAVNKENPAAGVVVNEVINFVITAVTIIVVAVPEGLPMAVTIALSYATIQMLKDQNLVRILAACETMGGATTICSDKTGTLTQNKMTVVRGFIAQKWFRSVEEIAPFSKNVNQSVVDTLLAGIAINSTAYEGKDENGKLSFVGSKTESALLGFVTALGSNYMEIRNGMTVAKLFPFSSERKRMSTLVKTATGYRTYCKGASEIVFSYCSQYLTPDGKVEQLDAHKRNEVDEAINEFATQALRTICLAYVDISEDEYAKHNWEEPLEKNLVFVGIVGIMDPLRPEVPKAIEQCKTAGIKVRMVTGDNIVTARNIAKNCGILSKGGIVMEGSEFRRLTIEQMDRIVPGLQVLARSSPTDKQLLVERLKAKGETVAVTGDGTNDAPALKLADVGFSMGIAGTEVAKEASDIILMDDNFASIVKAVIWGRAVYDAVRKFLQFQLTVNVTAVTLAFVTALADPNGKSVLTAVQLLWVNLIMDTMAALALATEPPTEALLNRKPHGKKTPLISLIMWKMILGQAIFQITVNLLLFYLAGDLFDLDKYIDEPDPEKHAAIKERMQRTIVFNTFVFMQIFNEFNGRRIDDGINVFKNIHRHQSFLIIFVITLIVQVLVCQFGGEAFKTAPLHWEEWLGCIGIALISLPIGLVVRLIPICCTGYDQPREEPEYVTREKLLWENAIKDVRAQIRVVDALRRHR